MQNQPGVLAHVSGMFASRGFNIESLAVGETENPHLSRITVVVMGDDRHLDQVRKQLEKIVTVVKVHDISSEDYVERDLMLIKIQAPPALRPEISALVQVFRGRIVDVSPDQLMIEISGQEKKIEAFIEAVRPYGIQELARTGRIALVRGDRRLESDAKTELVDPEQQEAENMSRAFRFKGIRVVRTLKEETPMAAKMYYDQDADLSLLKGKTIAVIGYGSQGHAQAQNLRDSGCDVVVGQRPGSANYELAIKDGFKPVSAAEAAEAGDLVNILLPDEVQGDIYAREIKPHLRPGDLLLCSHGFNIHFGQVVPPEGVDSALVAPKGTGPPGEK